MDEAIKLTILSPNQRTRWNNGHQQLRDDFADYSHLDMDQIGIGFHGIKEAKSFNVPRLFDEFGWPDVLMTYGLRYTAPFQGIKNTGIPKIHFACDLTEPKRKFPGTTDWYRRILDRDQYDYFFVHTMRVYDWLKRNGYADDTNMYWIPFGADQNRFMPWADKKHIHVSTMWSINEAAYPGRAAIDTALNELASHDRFIKVQTGKLFHARFAGALAASKMVVNTTSVYNSFNMKILEAMSSRCCLITEDWDDRPLMKEFVDMESIVLFDGTVDDMVNKIMMLLYNEEVMDKIATRAWEVANNNSNYVRAETFGKVVRSWMSQ